MPYFPERAQMAYWCPKCRAWYVPGNMNCCVAHLPGTCCHYGETQVPMPEGGTVIGPATLREDLRAAK